MATKKKSAKKKKAKKTKRCMLVPTGYTVKLVRKTKKKAAKKKCAKRRAKR